MAIRNNTEQTVTLHSYGDQELWYAQAQDSTWRLPLIVEWRHDKDNDKHYALVSPAVGLYINQSLALQALFQFHDVMGSKERWLIPRNICEAILHKAPGITPNRYYHWPEDGFEALTPRAPMTKFGKRVDEVEQKIPENPDFVSHVASRSGIPSSVIGMAFKAICREAPLWMLENKQALELGFCSLVALPFRPNWKEIVSFKCRKWRLRSLLGEKYEHDLYERLEKLGMPGIMCSPHNIGMPDRNHIDYTLEAIPTKKFQNAVNEVENKRLACGWNTYVAHYEESVSKLYKYAIKALGSYAKKAAAPFAKVSPSGIRGLLRFLPVGGKQTQVHGLALDNLPCHVIPPHSDFNVLAEGNLSDPRLVQAQIAAMPEMPNLLQAPNDLRKCDEQGSVVEQGPTGTNGLSLSHASQGQIKGEPVLAVIETDGTGMDSI